MEVLDVEGPIAYGEESSNGLALSAPVVLFEGVTPGAVIEFIETETEGQEPTGYGALTRSRPRVCVEGTLEVGTGRCVTTAGRSSTPSYTYSSSLLASQSRTVILIACLSLDSRSEARVPPDLFEVARSAMVVVEAKADALAFATKPITSDFAVEYAERAEI